MEWIKDIKNIIITVAILVALFWLAKDGVSTQDIWALGIVAVTVMVIWGLANFKDVVEAMKSKFGGSDGAPK